MSDKKKLSIYLASGWFSSDTREILDQLESYLSTLENVVLYSPRRDGIMLPPNQKHDTALRESIFCENISNIKEADLVVANIYSGDPYNDPGTMYEVGYAMANDVPVIGYSPSTENIEDRFKGILEGMTVIHTLKDLYSTISSYEESHKYIKKSKVLFVGNGNKEVDEKLVSYIMDSGMSIRWVNNMHNEVYTKVDEIFQGVDFMINVIDDRKTLSSWMIGQAYARNIPVVTYSNYNYGINIMLLVSVLTHIRGTDELNRFLQQVNRYGIKSIPKFDISQMDAM